MYLAFGFKIIRLFDVKYVPLKKLYIINWHRTKIGLEVSNEKLMREDNCYRKIINKSVEINNAMCITNGVLVFTMETCTEITKP